MMEDTCAREHGEMHVCVRVCVLSLCVCVRVCELVMYSDGNAMGVLVDIVHG